MPTMITDLNPIQRMWLYENQLTRGDSRDSFESYETRWAHNMGSSTTLGPGGRDEIFRSRPYSVEPPPPQHPMRKRKLEDEFCIQVSAAASAAHHCRTSVAGGEEGGRESTTKQHSGSVSVNILLHHHHHRHLTNNTNAPLNDTSLSSPPLQVRPRHQAHSQGPNFPFHGDKLTWNQSLSNLKVYRDHYGNCNVPQKYSLNPKLGRWINKQRKKKKNPEKYGALTPDQIEALDDLGFQWHQSV